LSVKKFEYITRRRGFQRVMGAVRDFIVLFLLHPQSSMYDLFFLLFVCFFLQS
jgi:hypothetical protein